MLSDPRPVPNALWSVHAAQLGLTVAEQALAEALVAGQSLAVFAEARDRSLHTVRAQLKALLAKTGTNGQTEMVAKLAPYFH